MSKYIFYTIKKQRHNLTQTTFLQKKIYNILVIHESFKNKRSFHNTHLSIKLLQNYKNLMQNFYFNKLDTQFANSILIVWFY
jgi:tRNA A22 N-methylase